jgi:hypothetical protein
MLQMLGASFLIEVLPCELLVRPRDCDKFKLDGATDGLKETILEVALMMRPEDGAAGVLALLREMLVIRDAAWSVHHLREHPTCSRRRFMVA